MVLYLGKCGNEKCWSKPFYFSRIHNLITLWIIFLLCRYCSSSNMSNVPLASQAYKMAALAVVCELNRVSVCPLDVLHCRFTGEQLAEASQWSSATGPPSLTRYSPLIAHHRSWCRQTRPLWRPSAYALLWSVPRTPFPAGDERKRHDELKGYELSMKDFFFSSDPGECDSGGEIRERGWGDGWGDKSYIRYDRTECSFMCLLPKLHSQRNSHISFCSKSYYFCLFFPTSFFLPCSLEDLLLFNVTRTSAS